MCYNGFTKYYRRKRGVAGPGKKEKNKNRKSRKSQPPPKKIKEQEEKKEQGLSLADKNKEEVRSGPDQSHP